jgi:hypothetical protein
MDPATQNRRMRHLPVCALTLLVACGQPEPTPRAPGPPGAHTQAAISALRASQFADASHEADAALQADGRDAQAAAVRAVSRYERAGETLVRELGAVLESGEQLKFLDHEKGRLVWRTFLADLEQVDRDLAVAAADPGFSLELCIACWKVDWNGNGRIDGRDNRMLELEFDGKGGTLEEGDPRRRPTYRFDVGDALWGRAMISFQRAAAELVLAYRWSELDKLWGRGEPGAITIKLIDPGRVKHSRELVIAALGFSAQERDAYLAETDDDREWVPSPRQKSYAMPLEVDDALYTTWTQVISDVHHLLSSQDGVRFREVVQLFADPGDEAKLPDAYLDLGRMFREPTDLVIDLRRAATPEAFLRGVLGHGYAETMRASPLVGRLRHMKEALDRGEDTMDRKLRYLFWLN